MSVFRGTVYSPSLEMRTGLTVLLPRESEPIPPRGVIYLLHGLSDNHHCWEENTMLSIFAEERNVAVVMPEVQRSYYMDMTNGPQYFSYVARELPITAEKLFSLRFSREKTAVMGLSMGGYGAMKCALTFPETFGVCCAFSAACDLKEILSQRKGTHFEREMAAAFGEGNPLPQTDDVFVLAERRSGDRLTPSIYTTCGRQDSLYPMNLRLRDHLKNLGYQNAYEEWDGQHDWHFWNESLRRAMDRYFPIPPSERE